MTFTHPVGQDKPALGLVYDHAYWASGIEAADSKAPASVTVTSGAIAHPDPDPSAAQRTTQLVYDTNAPSRRSIGELYSTSPGAGPDLPRTNSLIVKATNVSELTVDTTRARLRLRGLRIESDADKPLTLTLRGPKGAMRRVPIAAGRQSLTL